MTEEEVASILDGLRGRPDASWLLVAEIWRVATHHLDELRARNDVVWSAQTARSVTLEGGGTVRLMLASAIERDARGFGIAGYTLLPHTGLNEYQERQLDVLLRIGGRDAR